MKHKDRDDWRKDHLGALTPSFHEEQYESLDWDWDGTGSCDAWDLKDIPRVYCDMGQELLDMT